MTSNAQTPAAATHDPDDQHPIANGTPKLNGGAGGGIVEVDAGGGGGGDPSQTGGVGRRGAQTEQVSKKVASENRTTTPYMTKYERSRILGTRALQIRYVYKRSSRKGAFLAGFVGTWIVERRLLIRSIFAFAF